VQIPQFHFGYLRREQNSMLDANTCDVVKMTNDVFGHIGHSNGAAQMQMPEPRYRWYLPIKCGMEWILACVLLAISSPLLLVLGALVRLTSPGPALYIQTRLGRSGRVYRIYKLRTMWHNAEARCGPVWASSDDVRVTRLGRFLRDTHLDELPQLWNVLRGEMALIGPRPERPELAARIAIELPTFYHRLRMRPGITGLAQMLLPADDPQDVEYRCVRRKLAHDLLYLRDVGPILDLKIAASTSFYFFGATIDAVRKKMLSSYVSMVNGVATPTVAGELEEEAA
jgi:lipopolysaccharide/colanic/teichoic acid biosynthesis glycosyltransferase